jgi:hypothetical protein
MEPTNELDAKRTEGLEDLAKIELSEIIATANQHGFSASEVLDALSVAVAEAREALQEDPDPAGDPELPLAAEQGFDPAA